MTTESPSAGPVAPSASSLPERSQPSAGAAPPWTLIPVTMQFSNIAANSNLNFTFTTGGASWSLGARSGDSVGFSYNVTPASAESQSIIQAVEFNNAVLSIRTGNSNQSSGTANNAFTLTLFLQVRQGIDYVQGYCTLNNEAVVMVSFGSLAPVQWRNGRISAVLLAPHRNFRPVSFTIKGAQAGNRIDLVVSTKRGLGLVNWSLGTDFSDTNGVLLASQQGQIPLASMSYSGNTLSFVTQSASGNSGGNGNGTLDFYMNAYITWVPEDLNYVYLRASCADEVSILAQVNNRQPQIVSQADTVFTL
ncbi:hypothetical protein AAHK20_01325 [Trinickia sp. YCB016]